MRFLPLWDLERKKRVVGFVVGWARPKKKKDEAERKNDVRGEYARQTSYSVIVNTI